MSAKTVGRSSKQPEKPSDDIAQLLAARNNLHASLEKSRELGQLLRNSNEKMSAFKGCLSPVGKALAPVEEKSKIAEGLSHRIDKAMEPAMSVLKLFDVVQKLKAILIGDPSLDLDGYLAAVMQLEEALAYHRDESAAAVRWLQEAVMFLATTSAHSYGADRLQNVLKELQAQQREGMFDGGLFSLALDKLENEFRRLLAQYSLAMSLPAQMGPRTEDAPYSSSELEYLFSFPSEVLQKLQAIVARLAGSSQYQRCINAYQENRSARCKESLEALNVAYLQNCTPELVDGVPWVDLQNMIGKWNQQLEVVVKVLYAGERRLARQVFKDFGQPVWVECLSNLAQPGITAFLEFGESVSKSSRFPEKLCTLLDMLESMERSEHSVIQVFDGPACHAIRSHYRDLLKQVGYGAFRTFWDTKGWVEEQTEPQVHDGRRMGLCSFVVNFLNYLVREFHEPLNKVLRSQQSRRADEASEDKGLAHGILMPLQALERKVEVRAQEFHIPGLRHIFIMNNLQYMRTRVEKGNLKPILGESWVSGLGCKVEKQTLKYQKEVWQVVLAHLGHEGITSSSGGKSAGRSLVRQRVKAFTTAFDDTIQTHLNWVIQDEHLRDVTVISIIQSVVPAYRSYLETFGHLLEGHLHFSTKYHVKYTPEMVEQILGHLFSPVGQHTSSTIFHSH